MPATNSEPKKASISIRIKTIFWSNRLQFDSPTKVILSDVGFRIPDLKKQVPL